MNPPNIRVLYTCSDCKCEFLDQHPTHCDCMGPLGTWEKTKIYMKRGAIDVAGMRELYSLYCTPTEGSENFFRSLESKG